MQLDYTFERQLELEREAASSQAWQQGLEQGIEQGITKGLERGRLQEIISFVQDGDISIERGAQKAGMSMNAFRKAMAEAEQSSLLKIIKND